MARFIRLVFMVVISVMAGSGVLGEAIAPHAVAGLLPQAGIAEASEVDWQTVFPNGDFDDDTYAPGAPPANHDFEDALTSWTGQGMTLGTSGPTGDYGVITDSTVESPAVEITNNGEGTHVIKMDVGFLATNTEDLSCVGVTAVLESEAMESLWFTCENEDLPIWRTLSKTLWDIPVNDPIVMLMITTHGTVGIDNVGESIVPVPGWYSSWSGDIPTIEESGPEGNYLHLETTEEESSAGAKAEIPGGATSLVYWRRVSEGGSGAIHFTLSNGEEGEDEDFAMITDYIEEGDGQWVQRSVDLACPPAYPEDGFSGDCEIIYIDVQNWSGFLDFALSTSSDADADEDGLYDDWEQFGVLREGPEPEDGNFIDLPAMGADPDKPDIFIHLDYMCKAEDEEEQEGDCDEEHPYVTQSQRLYNDAVEIVVGAFADSPYVSPTSSIGINLHVDQGPDSILDFSTDEQWGDLSRAGAITFDEVLGFGDFNWDEFDAIKEDKFSTTGRAPIFHYAIAGSRHGSISNNSSGIARINGTDLIISLANFAGAKGNVPQQAGTLMHELGHNLGLDHGGDTDLNYKPNYLSVMNYSFQFIGLIYDTGSGYDYGLFDYSRSVLDTIDEISFYIPFDEVDGLGAGASGFGTIHWCGTDDTGRRDVLEDASDPIDWNCDSDKTDTSLTFNVNKDTDGESLTGFDDWAAIIFVGGAIGGQGDPGLVSLKRGRLSRMKEHSEQTYSEAKEKGLVDKGSRPPIHFSENPKRKN